MASVRPKIKYSKEETFAFFWAHYHTITKKPKTDKRGALRHWKALSLTDSREAFKGVKRYYLWALSEYQKPQFIKKARTYLYDRVWEDELVIEPDPNSQKYVKPKSNIVYD